MAKLRAFAFAGAWALWTLPFGVAIPLLWAVGTPERPVRKIAWLWAKGTLALASAIVGISYAVRGRAHVPEEPCLIICNHQSMWETVASLVLFPEVAVIAKRELLKVPVIGWYLRHSAMIVIDRNTGSQAIRRMLKESRAALAKGRSVLIFPEGTRVSPGSTVTFRRGVEFLYCQLNVPAVPVAVNSGRFWGRTREAMKDGTIAVSIMPAIPPAIGRQQFTALAERLINAERKRIGG